MSTPRVFSNTDTFASNVFFSCVFIPGAKNPLYRVGSVNVWFSAAGQSSESWTEWERRETEKRRDQKTYRLNSQKLKPKRRANIKLLNKHDFLPARTGFLNSLHQQQNKTQQQKIEQEHQLYSTVSYQQNKYQHFLILDWLLPFYLLKTFLASEIAKARNWSERLFAIETELR